MDTLIMDFVKNNRPISEIMEMPYHFVLEILSDQVKPKEEESLIAAFGG